MTDNRRTAQLKRTLGTTGLTRIAGISRPEISFQKWEISTRIKSATIADITAINKVSRFVTPIPNSIIFPRLDPKSTSVKMFTDASYNLQNGGLQGEHSLFIWQKQQFMWSSPEFMENQRSFKIHVGSRITCFFTKLWHGILDFRHSS